MSKSILIVVVLLVACFSSSNIRTLLWDDPWCNAFSADGSCCLHCSFRCYMGKNGRCSPVSDFCQTWDNCTGQCLSCYPGYAAPVNGICSCNPAGTPVVVDDHCLDYGYVDGGWKLQSKYLDGCKKVCTKCDCDYYLTCNYTCVLLPPHCSDADKYGVCTDCKDGYHLDCEKCVKDIVETPVDHCVEYGQIDVFNKWQSEYLSGCKKVCKTCECDYYLTCNYTCLPLPENCKTVDLYGKCCECKDRYDLVDGKCIIEDDHCSEYGYMDSGKKWYNSWIIGCKRICKCCEKGYYLDCDYKCVELPDNCKAADEDGECTECHSNYHIVKGKCVKDDDHCAEYGWIDAANKWQSQQVSGCKKICKCCDKGYYMNSKNQCVKSPANCEEVTLSGQCKSCCEGYHVEAGLCVINDKNCETYAWIDCDKKWYSAWAPGRSQACKCCDDGYFLSCDDICVKYPAKCEQVDEKGNCKDCCEGYHVEAGLCVVNDKNCETYAWIDCDDCDKKWYSAWAPGRSQACKYCDDGFYFNQKNVCQQLPCHCEEAKTDGTCTCCEDGYDLCNGECVQYVNKSNGKGNGQGKK